MLPWFRGPIYEPKDKPLSPLEYYDFDCISHRKGFRPSIQEVGAETSCG
jgi:hypothetical protein